MSYTKLKLHILEPTKKSWSLRRGAKPDYYEYDQAISNGDIKTNYDTLQTTWHKDGIHYTTNNRSHQGENGYHVGGGYWNEWVGYGNTHTVEDFKRYDQIITQETLGTWSKGFTSRVSKTKTVVTQPTTHRFHTMVTVTTQPHSTHI